MGLLAGVIEQRGIPTAAIALVRSVAERLRAPRMLSVPFPFGRPLGAAHDAEGQRDVLRTLLDLLSSPGPGPILRGYERRQIPRGEAPVRDKHR